MLALHKHPVTRPSDLRGASNGLLPEHLLRTTLAGVKLHHLAAQSYDAMVVAASRVGIDLPVSGGYRTYEQQKSLFLARYTTSWLPGAQKKVWQGRTYYKKPGVATAATPGTSNHGWGLALDFSGVGTQKNPTQRLRWLAANAESFGWTWELLPEEPWHLRYYVGDAVPPAVRQYLSPHATTMEDDDDMASSLITPEEGHPQAGQIWEARGLFRSYVADPAHIPVLVFLGADSRRDEHGNRIEPFQPYVVPGWFFDRLAPVWGPAGIWDCAANTHHHVVLQDLGTERNRSLRWAVQEIIERVVDLQQKVQPGTSANVNVDAVAEAVLAKLRQHPLTPSPN